MSAFLQSAENQDCDEHEFKGTPLAKFVHFLQTQHG